MFEKGVYLSIFYCLCYEMYISTDMLEDQVSEERDLESNEDEDIKLDSIREDNYRDVAKEGEDKKRIHTLRW